jgi:hypothetical protein
MVIGFALSATVASGAIESGTRLKEYLGVMQHMLDVSKPGDTFLACPAVHPVLRGDASYYWLIHTNAKRALGEIQGAPKISWREDMLRKPPTWIVPRAPKEHCYKLEEIPRELAPLYEPVAAPLPLYRLKSEARPE